jgi:hypothetical protein
MHSHAVRTGHDVHAENSGDDGQRSGQQTRTEKERHEALAGCRGHDFCSFPCGSNVFQAYRQGFPAGQHFWFYAPGRG